MSHRLVLFGAGHMGAAIARGMLRAGRRHLHLVDPDGTRLEEFSALGLSVDTSCPPLAPHDLLMLAMPPQAFPGFARQTLLARAHPGLVISVMAGVRMASIQRALGVERVVRAIPNTPSEVYAGMTLYCRSAAVEDTLADATREVLGAVGGCIELPDEQLLDPATALCGGGPAFVAYFADALQQFGSRAGLGDDAARRTVIQLLRGTALLLEASGKPALQVSREVMTPGGTTERGIWHFDRACLTQIVIDALTQSSLRSHQLGTLAQAAFAGEEAGC